MFKKKQVEQVEQVEKKEKVFVMNNAVTIIAKELEIGEMFKVTNGAWRLVKDETGKIRITYGDILSSLSTLYSIQENHLENLLEVLATVICHLKKVK